MVSRQAAVRLYVVERYVPGVTREGLRDASELLLRAAVASTDEREPVRYLGTTFLPKEESCFCRFEGTLEAIERVCERAGIAYARIVEASEIPVASSSPRDSGIAQPNMGETPDDPEGDPPLASSPLSLTERSGAWR